MKVAQEGYQTDIYHGEMLFVLASIQEIIIEAACEEGIEFLVALIKAF